MTGRCLGSWVIFRGGEVAHRPFLFTSLRRRRSICCVQLGLLAKLAEGWHARRVGKRDRFDCYMQTLLTGGHKAAICLQRDLCHVDFL